MRKVLLISALTYYCCGESRLTQEDGGSPSSGDDSVNEVHLLQTKLGFQNELIQESEARHGANLSRVTSKKHKSCLNSSVQGQSSVFRVQFLINSPLARLNSSEIAKLKGMSDERLSDILGSNFREWAEGHASGNSTYEDSAERVKSRIRALLDEKRAAGFEDLELNGELSEGQTEASRWCSESCSEEFTKHCVPSNGGGKAAYEECRELIDSDSGPLKQKGCVAGCTDTVMMRMAATQAITCPSGYILKVGYSKGYVPYLSEEQPTIKKCAENCHHKYECYSFEYSPRRKQCFLINKDDLDLPKGQREDYIHCSKQASWAGEVLANVSDRLKSIPKFFANVSRHLSMVQTDSKSNSSAVQLTAEKTQDKPNPMKKMWDQMQETGLFSKKAKADAEKASEELQTAAGCEQCLQTLHVFLGPFGMRMNCFWYRKSGRPPFPCSACELDMHTSCSSQATSCIDFNPGCPRWVAGMNHTCNGTDIVAKFVNSTCPSSCGWCNEEADFFKVGAGYCRPLKCPEETENVTLANKTSATISVNKNCRLNGFYKEKINMKASTCPSFCKRHPHCTGFAESLEKCFIYTSGGATPEGWVPYEHPHYNIGRASGDAGNNVTCYELNSPSGKDLKYLGTDGCMTTACNECEGDCDNDGECGVGLQCFKRNETLDFRPVPGCRSGGEGDVPHTDYCYKAEHLAIQSCSKDTPCTICQGDCNSDADCYGDLKCFHRVAEETVPGCKNSGPGDVYDYDYCTKAAGGHVRVKFKIKGVDMKELDDHPDEKRAVVNEIKKDIAQAAGVGPDEIGVDIQEDSGDEALVQVPASVRSSGPGLTVAVDVIASGGSSAASVDAGINNNAAALGNTIAAGVATATGAAPGSVQVQGVAVQQESPNSIGPAPLPAPPAHGAWVHGSGPEEACPMPTENFPVDGRICEGDNSTCLENNIEFETFELAWYACRANPACDFITRMVETGVYHLRRSDTDPANDDREMYEGVPFSCRVCPPPAEVFSVAGKDCANGTCINGDAEIASFALAWQTCGQVDGCGFINKVGSVYKLRRATDNASTNDAVTGLPYRCQATSFGRLYTTMATGVWCNNLDDENSKGTLAGLNARGYTLEGCKTACSNAGETCTTFAHDTSTGWCAIYTTCGDPINYMTPFNSATSGWSIFSKVPVPVPTNHSVCRTIGDAGVSGGHPCKFPFTFAGVPHYKCTDVGGNGYWCASGEVDENGAYKPGQWGYCDEALCGIEVECYALTMDPCIFPFVYQGIAYSSCTDVASVGSWQCATSVDASANALTMGTCADSCLPKSSFCKVVLGAGETTLTHADINEGAPSPVTMLVFLGDQEFILGVTSGLNIFMVKIRVKPAGAFDLIENKRSTVTEGSYCLNAYTFDATCFNAEGTTAPSSGNYVVSLSCEGIEAAPSPSPSTGSLVQTAIGRGGIRTRTGNGGAAPCQTVGTGLSAGQNCVFPFIHAGMMYSSCTEYGFTTHRCATQTNAAGYATAWGDCPGSCLQVPCLTTGSDGAGAGLSCVFPFKDANNVEYAGCIERADLQGYWCATGVNADGVVEQDAWARCGASCPKLVATEIETTGDVAFTIVVAHSGGLSATEGTYDGTWEQLVEGAQQFSDQSYTLSGIPPELIGKYYYKGPFNSGAMKATVTATSQSPIIVLASEANLDLSRLRIPYTWKSLARSMKTTQNTNYALGFVKYQMPQAYCVGGFRSQTGDICCAGTCGTCDQTDCTDREGGANKCCPDTIRGSGIVCSASGSDGCTIQVAAPCQTTGTAGVGAQVDCVLPWKYRGVEYQGCTSDYAEGPWCATKVDLFLNYVPGHWGACSAACPQVKTYQVETHSDVEFSLVSSQDATVSQISGEFSGTWRPLEEGSIQFHDRQQSAMTHIPSNLLAKNYYQGPYHTHVLPPDGGPHHCFEDANYDKCITVSYATSPSGTNWNVEFNGDYTHDYEGFRKFCASWSRDQHVFRGGRGPCPTKPAHMRDQNEVKYVRTDGMLCQHFENQLYRTNLQHDSEASCKYACALGAICSACVYLPVQTIWLRVTDWTCREEAVSGAYIDRKEAQSGWYASGKGVDCWTHCNKIGLTCSNKHLHNHDYINWLQASDTMKKFIEDLGGSTSATECQEADRSKPWPRWSATHCYYTKVKNNPQENEDCTLREAGYQRPCWCHQAPGLKYERHEATQCSGNPGGVRDFTQPLICKNLCDNDARCVGYTIDSDTAGSHIHGSCVIVQDSCTYARNTNYVHHTKVGLQSQQEFTYSRTEGRGCKGATSQDASLRHHSAESCHSTCNLDSGCAFCTYVGSSDDYWVMVSGWACLEESGSGNKIDAKQVQNLQDGGKCTGKFLSDTQRVLGDIHEAVKVSDDVYVFYSKLEGDLMKMSAVDCYGKFIEARSYPAAECSEADNLCVLEQWPGATRANMLYGVKDVSCQCGKDCFVPHVTYSTDLNGQNTNNVGSAYACQQRCATTAGCAHFSFKPSTGDCQVHGDDAPLAVDATKISGPHVCKVARYVRVPRACVNGNVHGSFIDQHYTVLSCAQICDMSEKCLAFEYKVQTGHCFTKMSLDTTGCNGQGQNKDLYVKQDERYRRMMTCDMEYETIKTPYECGKAVVDLGIESIQNVLRHNWQIPHIWCNSHYHDSCYYRTDRMLYYAERDTCPTRHGQYKRSWEGWDICKWQGDCDRASGDDFKWIHGSNVPETGSKWWRQSCGSWCGARGNYPMCTGPQRRYKWHMTVKQGSHHQVGISLEDWDGYHTHHTGSSWKFALLYSHHSGWNRHRGAGVPVDPRGVNANTFWHSTWDYRNKGQHFEVSLDCSVRQFTVRTEQQHLGTMEYPQSWVGKPIFAAFAGQSSNSLVEIYSPPCQKEDKAQDYTMMPQGTTVCPEGSQVLTLHECDIAHKSIRDKYQFANSRTIVSGTLDGVPVNCSVQWNSDSSDKAAHWNTNERTDNSKVATGEYRVICKNRKNLWKEEPEGPELTSYDSWIPFSHMTAFQSSTHGDGGADKALTHNPHSSYGGNDGTCTHTSHDSRPWWKVNLRGPVHVKKVRLTNRDAAAHRLHNVDILVGGTRCIGPINVPHAGTQDYDCVAYGSEVKVIRRAAEYMTICGFKVYGCEGDFCAGQAPAPTVWVPYGEMTATQSSIHANNPAQFGPVKPLTIHTKSYCHWDRCSCTHTSNSENPWWKVTLRSPVHVKEVMLTNRDDRGSQQRLQGIDIYVGSTKCVEDAFVGDHEDAYMTCDAIGNEVKLQMRRRDYMTLCGFRLKVCRDPNCRQVHKDWTPMYASGGFGDINLGRSHFNELFRQAAIASKETSHFTLLDPVGECKNKLGITPQNCYINNGPAEWLENCPRLCASDDRCSGYQLHQTEGSTDYGCKIFTASQCPTGMMWSAGDHNPITQSVAVGAGGWTCYQKQGWKSAAPTCKPKTMTWSDGSNSWRQSCGSWCGVRGKQPLCTDGQTKHQYTVTISSGAHHQVGIAKEDWDLHHTHHSRRNHDKFALLYSHNHGWNRHRGAAHHVSGSFGGTFDYTHKGKEMIVELDCRAHEFVVKTEREGLCKMNYPTSWTKVYAAAAGQDTGNTYTLSGKISTCSASGSYDHHGRWVKGGNGEHCGQVCAALGMDCDSSKPSSLNTNDAVRDAFAEAGYTCRSYHGIRNYAGTPFSKATDNDDCAPITAGHTSSCTSNPHGHHSPLCYCTQADSRQSKLYTFVAPGFCTSPLKSLVLENKAGNPGTDEKSRLDACASACWNRVTPLGGSPWADLGGPPTRFAIATSGDMQWWGRCWCMRKESCTIDNSATDGHNTYKIYEFGKARPYTFAVPGYCRVAPLLRTYLNNAANPGTDEKSNVQACALSCSAQADPHEGSWANMGIADRFSVAVRGDEQWHGMCYCMKRATCSMEDSSHENTKDFDTYDFIVAPTPTPASDTPAPAGEGDTATMARPAMMCEDCSCPKGAWLGAQGIYMCAATCASQGATNFEHRSGRKADGNMGDNQCACCNSLTTTPNGGTNGENVYQIMHTVNTLARRPCAVFDNWRKNWGGANVEIPLGATAYGAVVTDWDTCLELCRDAAKCVQAVFKKDTRNCYGMNANESTDQDSQGGSNTNWISAHCQAHDWATVPVPPLTQSEGMACDNTPSNGVFCHWKARTEYHIVRRECPSCEDAFKDVYLRWKGDLTASDDIYSMLLETWDPTAYYTDFEIFSSYSDAMEDRNPWLVCQGTTTGRGFPGDCRPTKENAPRTPQFNSLTSSEGQRDVRYSVYMKKSAWDASVPAMSAAVTTGGELYALASTGNPLNKHNELRFKYPVLRTEAPLFRTQTFSNAQGAKLYTAQTPCLTSEPSLTEVFTVAGVHSVGSGHSCVGAWKYQGITYGGCTRDHTRRSWCATEVDALLEFDAHNGKWGECAATCQQVQTFQIETRATAEFNVVTERFDSHLSVLQGEYAGVWQTLQTGEDQFTDDSSEALWNDVQAPWDGFRYFKGPKNVAADTRIAVTTSGALHVLSSQGATNNMVGKLSYRFPFLPGTEPVMSSTGNAQDGFHKITSQGPACYTTDTTEQCTFPFAFDGTDHNFCTAATGTGGGSGTWCSTQTTAGLAHVGGNVGTCEASCFAGP